MKKKQIFILVIIVLFVILIIVAFLISKNSFNKSNGVYLKSISKNNKLQIKNLLADSISVETISDKYSSGIKIENFFDNLKTELFIDSILLEGKDSIKISPINTSQYLYRLAIISMDSIKKGLVYENIFICELDSLYLTLNKINDSILINGFVYFNINDTNYKSNYLLNFLNIKSKIIQRWKGHAII
ncbi:MAG: hypothetical protein WBL11_06705, partial [Bacteroidales bacterium]